MASKPGNANGNRRVARRLFSFIRAGSNAAKRERSKEGSCKAVTLLRCLSYNFAAAFLASVNLSEETFDHPSSGIMPYLLSKYSLALNTWLFGPESFTFLIVIPFAPTFPAIIPNSSVDVPEFGSSSS